MPGEDRRLPVTYSPGVVEDLRALPSNEHRNLAILLIRDLVRGRERGVPMGEHAGLDLTGCLKAYFSTQAERRLGGVKWRIIYREPVASGRGPESLIHIVAVGARAAMAVYETAVARLSLERSAQPSVTQRRAAAATLRSAGAGPLSEATPSRQEQTPSPAAGRVARGPEVKRYTR